MSGSLGVADLTVVGAYLAATVVLSVRAARRTADRTEDFLLAGRTLTLPAFVATLVATWYGGLLGHGATCLAIADTLTTALERQFPAKLPSDHVR